MNFDDFVAGADPDVVVFTFNHEHKEWEFEWQGTVESFDTLSEAMTDYNFKRFEEI